MARSTYIYLVQGVKGGIVAAFTVKCELASWLDGWDTLCLVSRIRDGQWNASTPPIQLNPRTLEPAA